MQTNPLVGCVVVAVESDGYARCADGTPAPPVGLYVSGEAMACWTLLLIACLFVGVGLGRRYV